MKRAAAAIVLLLLIGAVTNVAVAWACALCSQRQVRGTAIYSWDSTWSSVPAEVRNLVPPAWLINKSRDPWSGITQTYEEDYGLGVATQTIDVNDIIPGSDKPGPDRQMVVVRSGFPFASMAGVQYVPHAALRSPGQTDQLPLKPIPVGFGVNSVLYAVIAYGVLRGAYAARRRLVCHPGHCHGCNYDLTGNTTGVCPECGKGAAE